MRIPPLRDTPVVRSVIEYGPDDPVVRVDHLGPQAVEHPGIDPGVTPSPYSSAVEFDNRGRVVVLSAGNNPVQQRAQHQPVIRATTMAAQLVRGFSYRVQTFDRQIDGVDRLR